MVNQNKSNIWNVTYMGIKIFDDIMSYKDTRKSYLNAIAGGSKVNGGKPIDFALYANAVKGPGKHNVVDKVTLINNVSYLGQCIYDAVDVKVPVMGTVFIRNSELLEAVKRGTIEQYGGKMSERPCTPLMNQYAQDLHETYQRVLETLRIEWAESHTGEFIHPNEDDFTGDSGIKKPVVPFIQPRAEYYWDKNGRIGYNDSAIKTHYTGTSEEKDPLNDEISKAALMYKIMRNMRARKVGEYPKDKCLACGETFERKSPNSRQIYCDNCKKTIRDIKNAEKTAQIRHNRGKQGEVPDRDHLFEKYAEHAWIGKANGKSLIKGEIKKGTLVKTSEAKGKTADIELAIIEPCECGSTDFEIYKPWKPEVEGGKYGKIGSKILYCKNCGLVVEQQPMRSYPDNNEGYMGE